ncbi:MAG: metal-dependent hydrolase [Candidatus Brocadiae bacterium]|nr:metal-dependent hydrolase [Candidatus Brocadiia bacterium]
MDTITQIALGATIAEAGFREKLGVKGIIFGGICGLLPDLDIVVRLQSEWAYLQYHRGISHSVFFLTLIAPMMGYLGYRYLGKKSNFTLWTALAFLALVTHPILDLFTSYGTQLLAPWTWEKLAIDAIPIIDFFYTVPLFLVLLSGSMHFFSYKFRRNFALAVLFITSSYIGCGYLQAQKAISIAKNQLIPDNIKIEKIRAVPSLLNIFLWRVVVQDDQTNFHVGFISTLNPKPIAFHTVINEKHPLIQKALDSHQGKVFQCFSMGLLSAKIKKTSQGYRIFLCDMRYGLVKDPSQHIFGVIFDLNQEGKIKSAYRSPRPPIRFQEELQAIWENL